MIVAQIVPSCARSAINEGCKAMHLRHIAAPLVCLLAAGAAEAQTKPEQSPLVQSLANCRAQTDDMARLRCYDQAAGALTEAAAQGNVVVVDQQDLKRARRSLFGFSLPKLPFFRGDESASEQQDEIAASVASARSLGYGKWRITLDSGAVWETTEASSSARNPQPGNPVLIKRGALGSYMMRIDGRRGLRSKRIG